MLKGNEANSGYRVTPDEPGEAAKRLGYPFTIWVIGGALKFHSGGHERQFLEEAEQSFCLPLMEEELSKSGTESILKMHKTWL